MLDKDICARNNITIPRHLAIIMDGNGRWATRRGLFRVSGHQQGANTVKEIVKSAASIGINELTLFAFSSENWKRPKNEVQALMQLFSLSLKTQTKKLHQNNIKLKIIGDTTAFSEALQQAIKKAEALTAKNTGLTLNVAVNYGGRWDITNALKNIVQKVHVGDLNINDITEHTISDNIATKDVDLLIRTGGEFRISNFLLWQCAYAEFYVTDTLWPDFNDDEFLKALVFFSSRERRFGMTSSQLKDMQNGN